MLRNFLRYTIFFAVLQCLFLTALWGTGYVRIFVQDCQHAKVGEPHFGLIPSECIPIRD